jgi:hypothetical protein
MKTHGTASSASQTAIKLRRVSMLEGLEAMLTGENHHSLQALPDAMQALRTPIGTDVSKISSAADLAVREKTHGL